MNVSTCAGKAGSPFTLCAECKWRPTTPPPPGTLRPGPCCSDRCSERFDANPDRYISTSAIPQTVKENDTTTHERTHYDHSPSSGTAIDPVCGLSVDRSRAQHTNDSEGGTINFCAAGCRAAFIDNPDAYAATATSEWSPAANTPATTETDDDHRSHSSDRPRTGRARSQPPPHRGCNRPPDRAALHGGRPGTASCMVLSGEGRATIARTQPPTPSVPRVES
jgi:YHS domain-containing protein